MFIYEGEYLINFSVASKIPSIVWPFNGGSNSKVNKGFFAS
jgi:hypothetical protein